MNEETTLTVHETVQLGALIMAPEDIIQRATTIAKQLAKIIEDQKLYSNIQGKRFVRVEGWSTLGAMLGVLPMERTELAKRYEDGSYEATVELIRINDQAIIGRASAYVGMDEKDRYGKPTWGSRSEYARKSMAITRATGKAYRLGFSWIVCLAGFEPTPAEEMDDVVEGKFKAEPQPQPAGNGKARPYMPEVTKSHLLEAAQKITKTASDEQRSLLVMLFEKCLAGNGSELKRHAVQMYLYGVESIKDVPGNLVLASLNTWMKPIQDSGGDYKPDEMAAREVVLVYDAALREQGQMDMPLNEEAKP